MGFVYIPGPFIEVDPSALKKNGTNSPTATMNWGDQDLVGVANLDITGQMASAHDTETQAASAVHTIDWNDGNSTTWDLQAANGTPIVLTLSNPKAGASYIIEIIQGSAIRNVTWPGTVKWPGGIAPVISTTNDVIDIISLFYDGTNYFGTFNQDFS